MATTAIDEMQAIVGRTFTSDWVLVDQPMVDAFADATGDRQFIHVDPVAAAATPFGGTIAHGFLTLSLMPHLAETAAIPQPDGLRMAVNYGCDSLRFLTPVRAGSRVRGHFKILNLQKKRPGQYQQSVAFTVEIEGQEKPALVAEWISQLFV